jgi:hypothetical protein
MANDDMNSGYLIVGFVAMLIGLSLISVISTLTVEKTDVSYANAETLTIIRVGDTKAVNTTYTLTLANPVTDWRTEFSECEITNFVLYNQTGGLVASANYTLSASTGTLTVKDVHALNTSASNTTTVYYNYCGDEYLTQDWSRSLLNTIPGFFALALLGIGIFVALGYIRKIGLA